MTERQTNPNPEDKPMPITWSLQSSGFHVTNATLTVGDRLFNVRLKTAIAGHKLMERLESERNGLNMLASYYLPWRHVYAQGYITRSAYNSALSSALPATR